jgi:hypothetical protein
MPKANMLSDKTLEVLRGGTQGEWEVGADLLTVQLGGTPLPTTKNGWSVRVAEAMVPASVGIVEANANARKIALVNPMARVCLSLFEYARSMIRQKSGGTGYLCAFCGSEHADEKKIEHEDDCPLVALSNLNQEARKHG